MNDGRAEPRSAAPLDVPMSTITWVGTSLWALGLVGAAIGWATGHLPVVAPTTCVVGILIGLYILRWLRHRPHQTADERDEMLHDDTHFSD